MPLKASLASRVSLCCVVITLTPPARATTRADFFDIGRPPTISFDRGRMAWTLRNEAVERIIRFDALSGGLTTLLFRDPRTGEHVAQAGAGAEGTISFDAALLEPPTLLTAWRETRSTPADGWKLAGYPDDSWSAVPLPDAPSSAAVWLRCAIPSGRMRPNHLYALMLEHAVPDRATIWIDGKKAADLRPEDRPGERTVQIDLPAGARMLAIQAAGGLTGAVGMAEVGSAPPPLDLSHDWKLMQQGITGGQDGGRVLTLNLSGVRSHEGFDLEVSYQVHAGDEPFIEKSFAFTSYRDNRFVIAEVVYDRWAVPAGWQRRTYLGTAAVAAHAGAGMLAAAVSPLGEAHVADDGAIAAGLRPYMSVVPGLPVQLPRSVSAPFSGTLATGAFLYQLFVGEYVSRGGPESLPAVYSTAAGYGAVIGETTCKRLLPLAAAIGADVFLLGDGWQTNAAPGSGRFGAWLVDRASDKFPEGLLPLSTLVRERGMRFGLWTTPIRVTAGSAEALANPNWLLQAPGAMHVALPGDSLGMCFSGGWAQTFGASMAELCREVSATYLQVDGALYYSACIAPDHDHPVEQAAWAQILAWGGFCDTMQSFNPPVAIVRGSGSAADPGPGGAAGAVDIDRRAEASAMEEGGAFGALADSQPGDVQAVYRAADATRDALDALEWTRPAFTLAALAPCRAPAGSDLAALQYALTSACASACGVQLEGSLDGMTPQEQSVVRKWIDWNRANRPWLAYGQPLDVGGEPANGHTDDELSTRVAPAGRAVHNASPVDVILHLRPALQGRYGYACLWNRSDRSAPTDVAFRPDAYFVHMAGAVEIVSAGDRSHRTVSLDRGRLSLGRVTLPPHGWAILEIRAGK